ncbi:DUF3471 domain-containing protein [Streptomyces hydrogenans]|uniref:DUF3471 domain-containing protein n=1 Tax=Streptomyces hydrogenans TaxID=1873719 RepID=UPI0035DF5BAB
MCPRRLRATGALGPVSRTAADCPTTSGTCWRTWATTARTSWSTCATSRRPLPARVNDASTGTYANDPYGPMTVSAQGGELTMRLWPDGQRFTLSHYDGDPFFQRTTAPPHHRRDGRRPVGRDLHRAVKRSGGQADKARVDNLDTSGLGTFTRRGRHRRGRAVGSCRYGRVKRCVRSC